MVDMFPPAQQIVTLLTFVHPSPAGADSTQLGPLV